MRTGPGRGAARTLRGVLLAALVLIYCLTACADDPALTAGPAVPPGSLAREVDLTGQTYVVGSKEFDEQLVLCAMTITLLRSTGAAVVDRCDTQGSENTRSALSTGAIDMYWEYTGTAWRTYLRQDSLLADPVALSTAVRQADSANGITWLRPAPFDDTYAVGVLATTADRLGVRTLSDLARLARRGAPEATLCVNQEFTGREDGLVGLLRTYDFEFPGGSLSTLGLDDIYPAVAAGTPCVFGEVFATDGRLNALRLTTLVDDRAYFLPYEGALTVRSDVLARAPRLALVADRLAPLLADPVMRELNGQVSVGRRTPADVAGAFLREQGLIG